MKYDLTGKRFGKLTVIGVEKAESTNIGSAYVTVGK